MVRIVPGSPSTGPFSQSRPWAGPPYCGSVSRMYSASGARQTNTRPASDMRRRDVDHRPVAGDLFALRAVDDGRAPVRRAEAIGPLDRELLRGVGLRPHIGVGCGVDPDGRRLVVDADRVAADRRRPVEHDPACRGSRRCRGRGSRCDRRRRRRGRAAPSRTAPRRMPAQRLRHVIAGSARRPRPAEAWPPRDRDRPPGEPHAGGAGRSSGRARP